MSELDKLEQYLKNRNIRYKRIDEDDPAFGRHQIVVRTDKDAYLFDAICQCGSYGFSKGLLEVMGYAVVRPEDGDDVAGYLTAEDVIKRFEEWEQSQSQKKKEADEILNKFEEWKRRKEEQNAAQDIQRGEKAVCEIGTQKTGEIE